MKLDDEIEEVQNEEEKQKRVGLKAGSVKAKESYGLPSWIIDSDFPAIPKEVEEVLSEGESQVPAVKVDKVLLRGLSKTNNTMKVLKFLYDRNNAFYVAEISRGLGMYEGTVRPNLIKLEELGLVIQKKFKGNTYFYIPEVNRKAAELAIIMWKQRISYDLARYIPYNRVTIKQIKEDKRFVEKSHYFGLTVDEAIDTLKKCPKIEVTYEHGFTFLSRREQGYIPPEHEQKATEVVEEKEPVEVE